jgi:hypothetical protein
MVTIVGQMDGELMTCTRTGVCTVFIWKFTEDAPFDWGG